MRRFVLAALAMATLAASPAGAQPDTIEGNWKTANGRAIVRIAPCGAGMCGRIVELPQPGETRDVRNPDEGKRGRGLVGLKVFWNLMPDGNRFEGKGYSPERGRYFDAEVRRDGNRLRVKGCVSLVCQTQVLTAV
jgi:uncharacterized protein (DUF2147 family)